jgi:hypothetical protein
MSKEFFNRGKSCCEIKIEYSFGVFTKGLRSSDILPVAHPLSPERGRPTRGQNQPYRMGKIEILTLFSSICDSLSRGRGAPARGCPRNSKNIHVY